MRIRLELGACSSQGKYQSVGGLRESQDAVLAEGRHREREVCESQAQGRSMRGKSRQQNIF